MKLGSKKMRERNFIEKGGRLLEEFISSCDGRVKPIRMYSAAELEKAIGNTEPVCHASFGDEVYYKGTCLGRTILIKKIQEGRTIDGWVEDRIFNELAVLAQVNHRNVVKLLGCCLETELPILVCEFVSNGKLDDYINDAKLSGPRRRLSWEDRLRIAMEVADALTYMHTATAKPIVLIEVKPSNIFLDENYSAKVMEFGLAISIPLGEETVTVDCIRDPTDKSIDMAISYIEEKLIRPELDAGNWSQRKTEQLLAFAVLPSRCLKYKGEERPTMKEVAQELRRIMRSSLETRNTTETENVSMEEVVQELRMIIRSLFFTVAGLWP